MFGFIGNIGIPELIIILVLALIIFGPKKLPEVGKSLGKSIREFKNSSKEMQKEISEITKDESDNKEVAKDDEEVDKKA